jgi:hypothetical protein
MLPARAWSWAVSLLAFLSAVIDLLTQEEAFEVSH